MATSSVQLLCDYDQYCPSKSCTMIATRKGDKENWLCERHWFDVFAILVPDQPQAISHTAEVKGEPQAASTATGPHRRQRGAALEKKKPVSRVEYLKLVDRVEASEAKIDRLLAIIENVVATNASLFKNLEQCRELIAEYQKTVNDGLKKLTTTVLRVASE